MHYLYRLTNNINGKVYIGQSIKPEYRWYQHKSHSAEGSDHKQYIHHAIAKYGVENFTFEIIATCRSQEDANEVESVLIQQYNSRDKQFGYNIKPGGNNAPHAEETKQKQSEATYRQIAEKGHPALGTKRTPEQIHNLIQARKDNPVEYTNEIRQRMSEAHIGKVILEEQRKKMAEGIKEQWKIRGDYDSKKCEAHGCEISGKAKYKIIDGVRYCNKHGLRMLRYGRINSLEEANGLISGLLTNIDAYLKS